MGTNQKKKKDNISRQVHVPVYVVISLMITLAVAIACYYVLHQWLGYGYEINAGNRGEYLGLLGTHCSVVFLSTSLMAMLSEKNKYIYWVDIVARILIFPRYMSFLALSAYALSTILWALVGLAMGWGMVVIASFLCGILAIMILFSRMISVYYQNEKNKKSITRSLIKNKDRASYEDCLRQLKDITFIKAGDREFNNVYDNIALIEQCIQEEWKQTPHKKEPIVRPQGYTEELYVSLILELSMMYPQEIQSYLEYKSDIHETLLELRYISYPILLNSYIQHGREDLFAKTLCKWGDIQSQRFDIQKYLVQEARNRKKLIAEFYHRLFNRYDYEVVAKQDDQVYLDVLEQLYMEDEDIYSYILDYEGTRNEMFTYYCEEKVMERHMRIIALLAEGSECKITNTKFKQTVAHLLNHWVVHYKSNPNNRVEWLSKNSLMSCMVDAIVSVRKPEEVHHLLSEILHLIEDLDSEVYLNGRDNPSLYRKRLLESFGQAVMDNRDRAKFSSNCPDDLREKHIILEQISQLIKC